MPKQVRLSPGEWDIIRALWDSKSRMTVREVLQKTYPNNERAYTTVQSFVKKVFDGSFQNLASYLVESDSLTLDDIEQLKKLIQSKEEELGGGNK